VAENFCWHWLLCSAGALNILFQLAVTIGKFHNLLSGQSSSLLASIVSYEPALLLSDPKRLRLPLVMRHNVVV